MPSSFMIACFSDGLTYPAVENRMSTMSPGARRRSVKITTDMPRSVRRAMTRRCRRYVFTRSSPPSVLLVGPHFLHPTEVVDRLVRNHVLHVRPHRKVVDPPVEDRPRGVGLELPLDRDVERQPLLWIELLRLGIEHLHDFFVAVLAVVARRAARIVLVVVGVGVVGADPGQVRADLIVAASGHGVPLRRLDLLQR